jgi:hypothetical protein
MIAADELGVTSENLDEMVESPPNQEVARLLVRPAVPIAGRRWLPSASTHSGSLATFVCGEPRSRR